MGGIKMLRFIGKGDVTPKVQIEKTLMVRTIPTFAKQIKTIAIAFHQIAEISLFQDTRREDSGKRIFGMLRASLGRRLKLRYSNTLRNVKTH